MPPHRLPAPPPARQPRQFPARRRVAANSAAHLLNETIEHPLFTGLIESHVQPFVFGCAHRSIAELLVENTGAYRDYIGARRSGWLIPWLGGPLPPSRQWELSREHRQRYSRLACQCGRSGSFHVRIREFFNEPAGDAALPVGVEPPVGGVGDNRASARAREADIGQPSLLL